MKLFLADETPSTAEIRTRGDFAAYGAVLVALGLAGRGQARSRGNQKFPIGMAATEWLALSPSTGTYWKACQAISGLGIGVTEADNSAAKLDSTYGSRSRSFRRRSIDLGVCLAGVYQALLLHVPSQLPQMRSKISHLSRFLRAVDAKYLNLGWDVQRASGGNPYRRTPQDVKHAIRAMDELGKTSSEHGIPLAYHAERDTRKEIVQQVLDGTNPKYVHWCADVGHLTAMGFDAMAVVRTYFSRLRVSHWKDFDPHLVAPKYLGRQARGDFVELGKGIVDFPSLTAFLLSKGWQGWTMIELDRTRLSSVQTSALDMERYVKDNLHLSLYPVRHHLLPA